MANCATCVFFMSRGPEAVGECRRYPNSRQCSPNYWCGEYQRLVVQKPAPGYNPPPADLKRPKNPSPAPPGVVTKGVPKKSSH